ncbi:MAG: segregation and condensation protein A [bacterium]
MNPSSFHMIGENPLKNWENEGSLPLLNDYKIVLDVFEGPLDLLIHLIKREKINIYDVSITRITDQYLAFLETMRILDLNIAGDFLVMAATLIYIKSRTLLSAKEEDEEEELEEQKNDLVERLVEYQKFKEAAEHLAGFEQEQTSLYFRPACHCQLKLAEKLLPDIKIEIFDLVLALQDVLHKVRQERVFIPIEITEIDMKDKIRQILAFLRHNQCISFKKILEGNYERQNIIITFLALLELVRVSKVQVHQSEPFGEVHVSINPPGKKFRALPAS